MDQDDRWLNRLAEAILSGTPPLETSDAGTELVGSRRAFFRQAQIIGHIAEFYRTIASDSNRLPTADDPGILLQSWGRLTLLEEIGRGAFGTVFRAKDPRLDREVALKLLRRDVGADPEHVAALVVEEGRLLARVHHANVVTIYDADRIDDRVGLTMELVKGQTLEQELQQDGPFSAQDLITTGIEVSRALAAVHDAGLLHRDIKAQNVMRQQERRDEGKKNGRLVLMDFGAGRGLLDEPAVGDLTGTPLYLAPETFAGQPATAATDIYSLGVLLYHLATGSFPVRGRSFRDMRHLHAQGERSRLRDARPDLPVALVRVIERAVDAEPSGRYQRAGDVEAALEQLAPRRATWRDRFIRVAVPASILICTALVFLLWRQLHKQTAAAASLGFQLRDAVLITRFDNRTGEPIFDGAVEYALERGLSGSDVMSLVPRERVDDALRLMKRPPNTVVDRPIGREVCLRDGHIKALLTGRIEKFGSRYVLTAELVDPADDRVVATFSEEAAGQQTALAALSRQASRVRLALGEQRYRIKGADPNVELAATESLRAFQLYNQSYQLGRQGNWPAALELARQVVNEDPRFGSGWVWLAWAVRNAALGASASSLASDDPRVLAVRPQYRPFLEHAHNLLERSPEWEQYWISGSYYTLLGDDARSVPFYQALLKLRPDHFYAANNLQSAARRLNQFDLVVASQQFLADQRPTDLYENARAATRTIEQLGRSPAMPYEAAKPYIDRMQSALERMGRNTPPVMASYLDFLPAYAAWQRDDIKQSLDIIDRVAADVSRRPTEEIRVGVGPELIFWYLTLGRASDAARIADRLDAAINPTRLYARFGSLVSDVLNDQRQLRRQLELDPGEPAPMFLRAGLLDQARRMMQRPQPNLLEQAWNDLGRGDLDLIEGHPVEAIPHLESGLRILKFLDNREYDRGCESLATALTRAGRRRDAIVALEECGRTAGRASNPFQTYRFDFAHRALRLADEYRAVGRVADATWIENQLREHLAYADKDFPLLQQLRNR